jgi:hypothetical protein
MSDERISVRKSTRKRLQQRKDESTEQVTYSDQLRELVPEDAEPLVHDDPQVVISVDEDVYDRVKDLAGEGVSLREVIEFYLYLDELDGSISPRQILLEVYRRDEQH